MKVDDLVRSVMNVNGLRSLYNRNIEEVNLEKEMT